jgi:hypothetical protein
VKILEDFSVFSFGVYLVKGRRFSTTARYQFDNFVYADYLNHSCSNNFSVRSLHKIKVPPINQNRWQFGV